MYNKLVRYQRVLKSAHMETGLKNVFKKYGESAIVVCIGKNMLIIFLP